jgi:2'-5' RNA ligase
MSFLGIKVPHEITRLLSEVEIPGEKVSRDEMHVTLCYTGKGTPIEGLVKIIVAAYEVTSQTKPFTSRTTQVTSFPTNPDDGVPIIARVESNELHALRNALCASFERNEVPFSKKYREYIPHITLGYSTDPTVHADHAADKEIPPVEWGVGEIVLWGGDAGDDKLAVTFPLSMGLTREAVYRAAVKFVTHLGHGPDGKCAPTCPCHRPGRPGLDPASPEAAKMVADLLGPYVRP